MPAPSSSLATLRPDLSASFMQFDLEMDRAGFITQQALTLIDVAEASGNFGQIPLAQLLQSRDVRRAPGSAYSRGNWTFDPETFATLEYGAEEPVDDVESKMYANYFDMEQICAQRAIDATLRAQEVRGVNLLFNTGTFTGALTAAAANAWSDPTNGTPITDVENAVEAVYANSGLWPNALIISKKKFRQIRLSSQVYTRIAAFGSGFPIRAADITVEQLKAVFDLEHIIVGGASKNTATEGQTAVPGQIVPNNQAMVCRVANSQDIREPCIGRIFHWPGDGSEESGTIESYRDETRRADIIRCRHQVQEKLLYSAAGFLITGV